MAAAGLLCTLGLGGCGAAGGGSAIPKPASSSPVTLKSLAVSPTTSSVLLGSAQQFTVTGHYSDSSARDLTQSAAWSSVQPAVATISSPGMAVSKQAGMATITATSGSISASATLTVSTPSLVSLSLSPSSSSLPKGETLQFTVTGIFSDQSTQSVTGTAVWTTSAGAVASINGQGLATAQSIGTATITVSSGTVSETATLTVTPPALTAMAITPINSSLGLGTNEQLAATGTFSDGSSQDLTRSVTWASGTPAVASLSAGGQATTWSIGTAKISASSGAVSVSGSIVVLPVAAIDYFSNAHNVNAPDANLNLVNTGLTGADLCAMVYVFDSGQEMNECCGCSVSQDAGMKTLSVNNDLTSNTLTGVKLTMGVIRIVPADMASNPACNAGTVTPSGLVLPWATHIQSFSPGMFSTTEVDSELRPLSKDELSALESDCAFIQKLGSGHGVCTCGSGD
jgi:Bacterial Ig-like domain (group 2)